MNYYDQQLHDCIYNNKPKAIKYTRTILVEKNLNIKEKTFEDYYREAEEKYYFNRYRRDIRDCRPLTAIKLVLSTHLYKMMVSELHSCYFLERCAGISEYDIPKFKYRGCEVEINPYNEDEEINLY